MTDLSKSYDVQAITRRIEEIERDLLRMGAQNSDSRGGGRVGYVKAAAQRDQYYHNRNRIPELKAELEALKDRVSFLIYGY